MICTPCLTCKRQIAETIHAQAQLSIMRERLLAKDGIIIGLRAELAAFKKSAVEETQSFPE